jgi:hypothetical protein
MHDFIYVLEVEKKNVDFYEYPIMVKVWYQLKAFTILIRTYF